MPTKQPERGRLWLNDGSCVRLRPERPNHSVRDKKIHVIFCGSFDSLPDYIRKLGPWQSLKRGDLDRLKTHYRLQLAEQGFVVVHQLETRHRTIP